MSELISKLTNYNLFNYLLPWIVFLSFLNNFTKYYILDDNMFILAFLSYFIWLVISRIGSIIIEPFLKYINVLKFSEYEDYIEAAKKDKKIEILSEQNNVFRTMIAMFLVILIVKLYSIISEYFNIWNIDFYILLVFLLILFILAYRKQTKYITARIKKFLENKQ